MPFPTGPGPLAIYTDPATGRQWQWQTNRWVAIGVAPQASGVPLAPISGLTGNNVQTGMASLWAAVEAGGGGGPQPTTPTITINAIAPQTIGTNFTALGTLLNYSANANLEWNNPGIAPGTTWNQFTSANTSSWSTNATAGPTAGIQTLNVRDHDNVAVAASQTFSANIAGMPQGTTGPIASLAGAQNFVASEWTTSDGPTSITINQSAPGVPDGAPASAAAALFSATTSGTYGTRNRVLNSPVPAGTCTFGIWIKSTGAVPDAFITLAVMGGSSVAKIGLFAAGNALYLWSGQPVSHDDANTSTINSGWAAGTNGWSFGWAQVSNAVGLTQMYMTTGGQNVADGAYLWRPYVAPGTVSIPNLAA